MHASLASAVVVIVHDGVHVVRCMLVVEVVEEMHNAKWWTRMWCKLQMVNKVAVGVMSVPPLVLRVHVRGNVPTHTCTPSHVPAFVRQTPT